MSADIFLETDRTFLRNLEIGDAINMYLLNVDPEVIRYTGDKPFQNPAEAEKFLRTYDQYKKFGVGRLAVIEKKSGMFLGWCGLRYTLEKDEYDIGFRFLKKFWNQGFATETAKACIGFGFKKLSPPEIIGRTMKNNIASIKVLCKLGMIYKNAFDFNGQEGEIYSLTETSGRRKEQEV
jgi:[ribosomal protein S5]-alanine N-acetyltransferase